MASAVEDVVKASLLHADFGARLEPAGAWARVARELGVAPEGRDRFLELMGLARDAPWRTVALVVQRALCRVLSLNYMFRTPQDIDTVAEIKAIAERESAEGLPLEPSERARFHSDLERVGLLFEDYDVSERVRLLQIYFEGLARGNVSYFVLAAVLVSQSVIERADPAELAALRAAGAVSLCRAAGLPRKSTPAGEPDLVKRLVTLHGSLAAFPLPEGSAQQLAAAVPPRTKRERRVNAALGV